MNSTRFLDTNALTNETGHFDFLQVTQGFPNGKVNTICEYCGNPFPESSCCDPIFIGGMERSGTSMVRAIIGSHRDIAVYEWDHQFWIQFVPNRAKLWRKVANERLLKELLGDLFSTKKYTALKFKPSYEKVYEILKKADLGNIKSYPLFAAKVFSVFMDEYLFLRNKRRWAFKSPWNEFYADTIFEAYPNAKFIHVFRNIIAVSSSMKELGWIKSDPMDFMQHTLKWNRSVELIHVNSKKYRGKYLGVNYDQFVRDPEPYTEMLCAFLGISYDTNMLKMGDHPGWKGSSSAFNLSSKTISPEFSERPTDNLAGNEIEIIKSISNAYWLNNTEWYPRYSLERIEAEYLNRLGEDFSSRGTLKPAELAFKKAIAVDPSYELPFFNLGVLYQLQNNPVHALKYFNEAHRLNPQNRLTVLRKGYILRNLQRYADAKDLYADYLKEYPEDEHILAHLKDLRKDVQSPLPLKSLETCSPSTSP
jgi:tetratricopeptide (TPR) repeat protein